MASDEEDDYMSDAILTGVQSEPKRPETYSQRRKLQLLSQQERGYNKPKALAEREAREEGLASHIPETNKGFQLLAKMGYKKGEALGRSSSTSPTDPTTKPLTTPLPLTLKHDRLGLGLSPPDTTPTFKRKHQLESLKSADLDTEKDSFRHKMNQQFSEKRVRMDVKHARITCEQLDLKMGLERNEFWISKPVEEGKEEAEAERRVGGWGTAVIGDVDLEGEQAENTQYAKEVIEINNNDDDDLEESVRAWDKSLDTTSPHSNDNLTTEFEDLEPSDQLQKVNTYLRTKHFYCLWCGETFQDEKELLETCPGPTRDDH